MESHSIASYGAEFNTSGVGWIRAPFRARKRTR